MKIIVTDTNGVVLSKDDTNLTTATDTALIDVGGLPVHLVDDTDTHNVGDTFTVA
jgi:hypothetical protein